MKDGMDGPEPGVGIISLAMCAVVILAMLGGMVFGGRALDAKLALDARFTGDGQRGLDDTSAKTLAPCGVKTQ